MVRRHQIIEESQLYLFRGANPQDAGILNRKGFYFFDWGKGVPMDRPYVDEASLYKAEYKKGTKGPCWDGYTYVGETPYSKGSCVKNAETSVSEKVKVVECKVCGKNGHSARQCVSENVPFSQGGYWQEYEEGYRPIPDSKGKTTYKSQFGDGKKYQLRDRPFKFGYQESDMFWNEKGVPYRVKEQWFEGEPYVVGEKANFGYANKDYTAGIVKSKKNAPIILSHTIRLSPLENYASKTKDYGKISWRDLKKRIKANNLIFATNEYDASVLKNAFKHLPLETILHPKVMNNSLLIMSFLYGGKGWDLILPPSKIGIEKERKNMASLYKAELEPTIQREENESIQDYADRLTQQRLEQRSVIEGMYRPDMNLKERAELFQKEIESYSGVNIGDQWLYSMKRDDGSRGYVLMRLDSGNYGNYLYISTLVRPQKLGGWSRDLPRYIKQDFEGKGFAGDFLRWLTAMSDYRQVPVLLSVQPFIPSYLGPFSKEGFYMRKDLEGTSCEVCEYDDWLDYDNYDKEELYEQGLWDSAKGTWKYGGKLRLSEISGDSMKYTCELCGNYEYAPWVATNTREQLIDYYSQFGFQSAKSSANKEYRYVPVEGGLDYSRNTMIYVPMERTKPNLLMRLRLVKKPVIERPKSIMSYNAETKPPKTSKGLIVYPYRMAELIRDGDKSMIVKDKPLDIAGKRYTVVTKRKGYAYIQLGAMQTLTLPKFKALKDKHLITPEERAKYFKGKRRLYAWPVKVLREFDKPYPTNAPLRPQDIAPKLKTYASEETKAHDWELNGVGYDGETVSITCRECGHSDYAQCHIHQLEDLGKNDPKKPVIVRGKDACMNGVQEDCEECEGTGTCDPDFCYAEDGEPHCSLCKGTTICYYCEGTGLDPDFSEGDESHRWRVYAMPHLNHKGMQGVKIICEDCGVGDVFQAFVPSECYGFQGTCLCDFCESHRIDQLEKIDYVIF